MKDTNAIEKALRQKSQKELDNVVDTFINDLEVKIRGEYNSTNYYDFKSPNGKTSFHVMGTEQMRKVLKKMLHGAHIEAMVEVKSKELINKLELV